MMPVDNMRAGGCHSGAVRVKATLVNRFDSVRRCTYSYCRMGGAVVVSAAMSGVSIVEGWDALTSYRCGMLTAEHVVWSRCGISTHDQRQSDANQFGVSAVCLDG
jgi:hypothetical protein